MALAKITLLLAAGEQVRSGELYPCSIICVHVVAYRGKGILFYSSFTLRGTCLPPYCLRLRYLAAAASMQSG